MPTDQRLISLLEQHEMLCPSCEYNLHRLSTNVCPECGSRLSFTSVIRKNYGKNLRAIEYGIPINFFAPPAVAVVLLGIAANSLVTSKHPAFGVTVAVFLAVSPFVYLILALLILDARELRIADTAWRRRVLLTVWAPSILVALLVPLLFLLP